uniref:Secreted protein n=1 Tax=Arundo donax TaxID=35708 RepID=A0A0A9CQK6_ARUDO
MVFFCFAFCLCCQHVFEELWFIRYWSNVVLFDACRKYTCTSEGTSEVGHGRSLQKSTSTI